MLLAPLSQSRGGMVSAGTVCFMYTIRMEGKGSPPSVSVSTGTQEKREARRGFCLLSLHGAAQDSQYSGKSPRDLCSLSRGGTRIGRKMRTFLRSRQLQILFSNLSERSLSLSQGTLDEDCVERIGGRQGKEREKEVRKTDPVLRVFAYCKGREGDVIAGGRGTSVRLPEVTSKEQISMDIYAKSGPQHPMPNIAA